MMAAGKSMTLKIQSILLDLNDDEFERFKWTLRNLNDQIVIPKSALEKASRERTVDVLVDRYPSKYCNITRTVLEKCRHNDLANRLLNCEAVQSSQPLNITFYQETLQSNLQDRFKCVQEGFVKKCDKQLLNDIYTELHVTAGFPLHIDTQHEAQANREKEVDTEEPIRPSQVFQAPAGRPVRTVLTSGNAGIGKTFFVRKFVLDWAKGQTNKDVHLVFPFTFRKLNLWRTKEMSLSELIHSCVRESIHIPKEELDSIFQTLQLSGNTNFDKSSFKLLFILDGLDESQLKLQCSTSRDLQTDLDVTESTSVEQLVSRLINRALLPSARLWITTRPATAGQIHPDLIDVVTEVRGFTDQQKEEYFTNKKKINDGKQAKIIMSHIKASRSLHAMCHIPVFCWITATVLKNLLKTMVEEDLPTGLTEMYIHFMVIRAKLNREKSGARSNTGAEIQSLGTLAFEQLQNGNLIFTGPDLKARGITMGMATDSGLITQLIKEERGLYQDKVYCFVHLSVQEFLAALHVHLTFFNKGVNLLSDAKAKRVGRQIIDASRFYKTAIKKALSTPNLDLFLRFLLGLSLQSNQEFLQRLMPYQERSSLPCDDVVSYLKKKIGEDRSPEGIINLFHCLNELNDRYLVEDIQKNLRTGNLPINKMSPSQWSAVGFILLSSGEDQDVFDLKRYCPSEEVLLRLMPLVKASEEALLDGCNLSERSCTALLSTLSSASCSLTKLDLSNNCLQDSGVKLLCEGLQSPNCMLKSLRLSDCLITTDGCSSLASALSSRQSRVRDLDVSYNHPGNNGAKQLKAWQNAGPQRSCRLGRTLRGQRHHQQVPGAERRQQVVLGAAGPLCGQLQTF
ncbi:protein NLRC3-like isoform X2 [Nelusetta ayraudi]|uniref:protein NLRC3-like isoform X2 n=1 Tax=Nelusetta ayraudi TaxID=303726 RepID=UPI003F6ECFB0